MLGIVLEFLWSPLHVQSDLDPVFDQPFPRFVHDNDMSSQVSNDDDEKNGIANGQQTFKKHKKGI